MCTVLLLNMFLSLFLYASISCTQIFKNDLICFFRRDVIYVYGRFVIVVAEWLRMWAANTSVTGSFCTVVQKEWSMNWRQQDFSINISTILRSDGDTVLITHRPLTKWHKVYKTTYSGEKKKHPLGHEKIPKVTKHCLIVFMWLWRSLHTHPKILHVKK